ncbi:hypothetical protein F4860DRAFT_116223 [Xylaria cubensis]|nr:hypothetical protein F4860DRAFT_116223 [Xylaria cubensis]
MRRDLFGLKRGLRYRYNSSSFSSSSSDRNWLVLLRPCKRRVTNEHLDDKEVNEENLVTKNGNKVPKADFADGVR